MKLCVESSEWLMNEQLLINVYEDAHSYIYMYAKFDLLWCVFDHYAVLIRAALRWVWVTLTNTYTYSITKLMVLRTLRPVQQCS